MTLISLTGQETWMHHIPNWPEKHTNYLQDPGLADPVSHYSVCRIFAVFLKWLRNTPPQHPAKDGMHKTSKQQQARPPPPPFQEGVCYGALAVLWLCLTPA